MTEGESHKPVVKMSKRRVKKKRKGAFVGRMVADEHTRKLMATNSLAVLNSAAERHLGNEKMD